MSNSKPFFDGLISNNPVLVFVLGACPTLAVTNNLVGGLSIAVCTFFVLLCSNITISVIKRLIPTKVEITTALLIIATYTAVVQLVFYAYFPLTYDKLGIYCPLIVTNVVILRRAAIFAVEESVVASFFDALGNGFGFVIALALLSSIRELLGTGRLFEQQIFPEEYGSSLIIMAPGALIVFGFLIAFFKSISSSKN
jgi:Na+-translocating ferredoxin:NAD+ oxidoreductase subunit E